MLLVVLALQGAGDGRVPVPKVQIGVTVRPDTVTVGEPFTVLVRVRAPLGSAIAFPDGPDSGAVVEAVDPRTVRSAADSGAVDVTAAYRLVAWDTGARSAGLGAVRVTGPADQLLTLREAALYVRSVLPRDTALHVPKPERDILAGARPWWYRLLAALLALAITGLLLWAWWRRRRYRRDEAQVVDAFERAEAEFARIDALGLVEAGERGRLVALAVDVTRDYLAARLPEARPSLTSGELLGALQSRREIPADRLRVLLAEADLVKFARRNVSGERARELSLHARALVRDVESAVNPRVPDARTTPASEVRAA
ncbi:MAG: hypothetical protein WKG32_00010 [Gemmatimonadaceae bacterium]